MRYWRVTGKVEYSKVVYDDFMNRHCTVNRQKEINSVIKAKTPEQAVERKESMLGNDPNDDAYLRWIEWVKGPTVIELPEYEYMRLTNAPVLFSLDPV